jgi:hypothetical protein
MAKDCCSFSLASWYKSFILRSFSSVVLCDGQSKIQWSSC